jgi:hypothetical protein
MEILFSHSTKGYQSEIKVSAGHSSWLLSLIVCISYFCVAENKIPDISNLRKDLFWLTVLKVQAMVLGLACLGKITWWQECMAEAVLQFLADRKWRESRRGD